MTAPALGLLFGLLNTTTLHMAKAMQRHGIDTLRWFKLSREERSKGRASIYLVGLLLNQLTPLWLILANRFSAPAYATGMFGVGLVLLLMYSSFVLKEPVAPVNYLGAVVVLAGTVLFSLHAINHGHLNVAEMNRRTVTVFIVIYMVTTGISVLASLRVRDALLTGLTLGLFSGGAAALDPILKAIGQNASGAAALLPSGASGWIPFGLSFLFGPIGFFSLQFAFLKGTRANVVVPFQSSVYVLVPVAVQLLALPGYSVTPVLVTGIVCIVVGIVLMQIGRERIAVAPASEGAA